MASHQNAFLLQLLQQIHHSLLEGDYLSAVSMCCSVLESAPGLRSLMEDDLTLALRNWGEDFAKSDYHSEDNSDTLQLLEYYHKAICLCPGNSLLKNNLAGFLFNAGYVKEAIEHLRCILWENPDFLKSHENLQNIYNHLVEGWHFRMLNDTNRNSIYQRGIETVLCSLEASGDPLLVLDIGAGTGLLSMFAALTSQEVEVYGCEKSPTMHEVCSNVLAANGLNHRIKMINKSSADLSIPNDLPQKADVVITETFDSGFFGEHILATLSHAWNDLMKEKCLVIPCKATIYVAAVECESIRQQNRLLHTGSGGLNLNFLQILCTTGNRSLCSRYCSDVTSSNGVVIYDEDMEENSFEPYSSEFLNRVSGGFKWLSNAQAFMEMHLDKPEDIKFYQNGFRTDIELDITECGQLDALVVWFDLHLSKDHVITTSPFLPAGNGDKCQAVCWEQAVFPVLSNHLNSDSITTAEDILACPGNKLLIDLSLEEVLHLTCYQILGHENFQMCSGQLNSLCNSNEKPVDSDPAYSISSSFSGSVTSGVQSESDLNVDIGITENSYVSKLPKPEVTVFLPRNHLSILNSVLYQESCVGTLRKVKERFDSEGTEFRLVTLAQCSLFLPVQALKLGADKVLAYVQNLTEQNIMEILVKHNDVAGDRLVYDRGSRAELDKSWTVLFVDLIDSSGLLRQNIFEDIAMARATKLLSSGLIVPNRVRVFGKLVNSTALQEDMTVVSDERTRPCVIAGCINEYQMVSHSGIELSTLAFTPVTNAFQMFSFDLNDKEFLPDLSVYQVMVDPQGSSFQECLVDETAQETTTITALVYWFELDMVEGVVISTLNEKFHWRQAAILTPNMPSVNRGDIIKIRALCSSSCFKVDLAVHQLDSSSSTR